MTRRPPYVRLLITDFDNTLFDWLGPWCVSFEMLLTAIQSRANIARPVLLETIRLVHQRFGTSEPHFLIEELHAEGLFGHGPLDSDWHRLTMTQYEKCRANALALYPTVKTTLTTLRELGLIVIAYTESVEYAAIRAIQHLGLDRLLTKIYVMPHQNALARRVAVSSPNEGTLGTRLITEVCYGSVELRKPHPALLLRIIGDAGVPAGHTLYVGDGITKDVLMAQRAGITDIHAVYGDTRYSSAYNLLREVSHWSDTEIAAERAEYEILRAVTPSPQCLRIWRSPTSF